MNATTYAGRLADRLRTHVSRAADVLANLHRAVRERVAEVVGDSVAEAVREAVQLILLASPTTQPPQLRSRWDADDPYARDNDDYDDEVRYRSSPVPTAAPVRLTAAVSAAWHVTLWWLRRAAGRRAAWAAAGLGLAAGFAAYALGPAAAATAAALSAIALARRAAEDADTLSVNCD